MLKLENFIKGPLTTLLGFAIMVVDAYFYFWTDMFGDDWRAPAAVFSIGFIVCLLRAKVEEKSGELLTRGIDKILGKKEGPPPAPFLVLALLSWASLSFGQSTDAALTTQINSSIRSVNTAGGITKTAVADVLQAIVDSKVNKSQFYFATVTGTDTYVGSTVPAITSYSGLRIWVKFTNGNTGPATINLNGLGARNIRKEVSTALASGDIPAGKVMELVDDGTNFQLIGFGGVSAAYVDAKVVDAINNGVTTTSPSENAVFDALALKADKEDFETLSFGGTTTWATASDQNPLAKVTATGSFTVDMTNVKSGSTGILKLITNTASAVTITFDTDFTNVTADGFNAATLTTYTFQAGTGKDYFLNYVADGTKLHWNIIDPSTTNGVYGTWVPVNTGYSVDPTTTAARFTVIGKMCHFYMSQSTNGTSSATTTTITLPLPAANTVLQDILVSLRVDAGTAAVGGLIRTRLNSNVADIYPSALAGSWTGSGNKRGFVNVYGVYEIQ